MVNLGIFIAVCAVAALLLYISFVQYRRAENALNSLNTVLYNMEQIQSYIKEASATLANPQLRAAFEADDEVGTFFKQITDIQEVLDQILPQDEETVSNVQ